LHLIEVNSKINKITFSVFTKTSLRDGGGKLVDDKRFLKREKNRNRKLILVN